MTFKNATAIKSVCSLLIGSVESVIRTTEIISEESELTQNRCEEFRFDDLERIQRLVLDLTNLIADDEPESAVNGDGTGSAFAHGELTSDLGDKTDDEDTFPASEGYNEENEEED